MAIWRQEQGGLPAFADAEVRKGRLIRGLAEHDDPDGVMFDSVQQCVAELEGGRTRVAELAALEAANPTEGRDTALLDTLPLVLPVLTLPRFPSRPCGRCSMPSVFVSSTTGRPTMPRSWSPWMATLPMRCAPSAT
jgi:hypothetical protein